MAVQLGPVPSTDEKSHVRQNTAIQQLFSNLGDVSTSLDTLTALVNALFVGRSSIAANYSVQNSDKYSTLGLNGGFFTVTFGSPSGYDTIFSVTIANEDTDKAKTIVLTNYADGTTFTFFLWPLQSYLVYSDNSRWFLLGGPQRWENPDNVTVFVDPAGSINNDGLDSTRAIPDLLTAWNRIQTLMVGSAPLIQMKNGATFGPQGELTGDGFGESGRIIEIQGDPTLVNPPIIDAGPAATGVKFRDGAWTSVGGVKFVAGSSSIGVAIEQGSLVDLANCDFGTHALGVQVAMSDQCLCQMTGTNKISGGAAVAWSVGNQSRLIVSGSFAGAGAARAFTSSFLNMQALSLIDFTGASFSGIGSFTGQKYSLNWTCVALSGGVVLPGSIAGTVDATSVYV